VDALRRLQAKPAAEMDALLPAILDKAFKGELSREQPSSTTGEMTRPRWMKLSEY
jgi:hypothetical protein